jgi:hypothetical protein
MGREGSYRNGGLRKAIRREPGFGETGREKGWERKGEREQRQADD